MKPDSGARITLRERQSYGAKVSSVKAGVRLRRDSLRSVT